MSETTPESNDNEIGSDGTVDPPKNFFGICRNLGPGLIIAGSIVGSGELIATTTTGGQAGISLLWLIIIGCVIKVFCQIELGRYTITHGETTLSALNRVPGPRLRVNWIVWYWLIMMIVGLGQVGGIVGGVGQSLALAIPINGDYLEAIQVPSEKELKRYIAWSRDIENGKREFNRLAPEERTRVEASLAIVKGRLKSLDQNFNGRGGVVEAFVARLIDAEVKHDVFKKAGRNEAAEAAAAEVKKAKMDVEELTEPQTYDAKIWAAIVTVLTIALIYRGRYGLIQNFSTILVVTFTFITVGNVIALQMHPEFGIPTDILLSGLLPSLPEMSTAPPGLIGWVVSNPVATALATFGIIGVGASELVAYPYWCLEKGYARFTGPRSDDPRWAERARGWMKVMHYDAFASMMIYTIATIAFFIMGVAVMHSQGLNPSGMRMVSTLMEQYVPIFGDYAKWLFLFGAVAVLYSTFLVATAGFARMYTDALKVYGLLDPTNAQGHQRAMSFFSVLLPTICLAIFSTGANPVTLVLLGGTMQAIMLPMLGFAALFFRYRMMDGRLKPGILWDVLLFLSSIGLMIAGGWQAYSKLS